MNREPYASLKDGLAYIITGDHNKDLAFNYRYKGQPTSTQYLGRAPDLALS